jgi:hypothetical protein
MGDVVIALLLSFPAVAAVAAGPSILFSFESKINL